MGPRHGDTDLSRAEHGANVATGPDASLHFEIRARLLAAHKVVIVAIARRLVTIANAILKSTKPWQTKPAA